MKLDTLQKLYTEELRDLYNSEMQLLKALPKMANAASSEQLKDAFEMHLEQTKSHVERLDEVFEDLGEKPKGKTCHGMKGLIEEGSEMLDADGEESVLDAGIIVAAQKVDTMKLPVTVVSGLSPNCLEKIGRRNSYKLLSVRNRWPMSF